MVLPTSGPISIGDLQTEYGGTSPNSLTEYYRDTAFTVVTNPETGSTTQNPNSNLVPHSTTTLGNREVTQITIPTGSSSTGTESQEEFFINAVGSTGDAPTSSDVTITATADGTRTTDFSGSGTDYTATDTTVPNESASVVIDGTRSAITNGFTSPADGTYSFRSNTRGADRTATYFIGSSSDPTVSNSFSVTGASPGPLNTGGGRYADFSPGGNLLVQSWLSPVFSLGNAEIGNQNLSSGVLDLEWIGLTFIRDARFIAYIVPGNTTTLGPNDNSNGFFGGGTGAGTSVANGSISNLPAGSVLLHDSGHRTFGQNTNITFHRTPNVNAYRVTGLSATFNAAASGFGSSGFRIYTYMGVHTGGNTNVDVSQNTNNDVSASYGTRNRTLSSAMTLRASGGVPVASATVVAGSTVSYPSGAVDANFNTLSGSITGFPSTLSGTTTRSLTAGRNGASGQSESLPSDTNDTLHFFTGTTGSVTTSGRTASAGNSVATADSASNQQAFTVTNNSGVALSSVTLNANNTITNGTITYNIDSGTGIAGTSNSTSLNLGSFTVGQSKSVTATLTVPATANSAAEVTGVSSITGTRTVTNYQYTAANSANTPISFNFFTRDFPTSTTYTANGGQTINLVTSRFNTGHTTNSFVFSNTNPSSIQITIDGTSETLQLTSGLTGDALDTAVLNALNASSFVSQFDRVRIANSRVEFRFTDTVDHIVGIAFTNNNGNLATSSTAGEIVQGGSTAVPSAVRLNLAMIHNPSVINIILNRRDDEDAIADTINTMVNAHPDFTSTVNDNVITITDDTRRAQSDITLTVTTAGTSNLMIPSSAVVVTTPGTNDVTTLINQSVPAPNSPLIDRLIFFADPALFPGAGSFSIRTPTSGPQAGQQVADFQPDPESTVLNGAYPEMTVGSTVRILGDNVDITFTIATRVGGTTGITVIPNMMLDASLFTVGTSYTIQYGPNAGPDPEISLTDFYGGRVR